jgi:hypothetical protein
MDPHPTKPTIDASPLALAVPRINRPDEKAWESVTVRNFALIA